MESLDARRTFPLLSPAEWELFERQVAEFESACVRGERPSLAAAASMPDPSGGWLIVELAHADAEFRVAAGEVVRLEEYSTSFPELARRGDALESLAALLGRGPASASTEPAVRSDSGAGTGSGGNVIGS